MAIDPTAQGLAVLAQNSANAALANLKRLPRLFPNPTAFPDIMPLISGGEPTSSGPTKGTGCSGVTSVANGGSGYANGDQITIAGGTTPGSYPTVVQVTANTAGVITAVGVVIRGIYTTAPSNPVSQASSTGSGTGATFNLTYGTGSMSSNLNPVGWGPTNAAFRYLGNGPANISSSGYYGMAAGNGTAMVIEWMYDGPHFDFFVLGNNMIYNLFVGINDQWQQLATSDYTTDASGSPYAHTIDWGGTTANEAYFTPRHYRFMAINTAFGGISGMSNGTVWLPTDARRPLAWCLGDSYTFGTFASSIMRTAWNLAMEALGLDWLPDGIGGTGWNSTGSSAVTTRITQKLLALTFPPDYVFFNLGYNDNGDDAGQILTLQANFAACVVLIQSNLPKAKIICIGPATPEGATTGLDNIRTALIASCALANIPFIDVRNFVNNTNSLIYTYSDNTHPNHDVGYGYLGSRYKELIWPYL